MNEIPTFSKMKATIRDSAARKGETMTVDTDEMKTKCIEALRHADLVDRIAELATKAVVCHDDGSGVRFYEEVVGVSPFRILVRIHILIAEAKGGKWPKEEA